MFASPGPGDDLAKGEEWVRPLRQIDGCVLDTVRPMPYREVGTIHHEPVDEPVPAFDRNVLLRDFDLGAAAGLYEHAGPDANAPFLVELRAWGGALSRPPAIANAVGGRDARFSLLAISDDAVESRSRRDDFLDAMEPWATQQDLPQLRGCRRHVHRPCSSAYGDADYVRLRRIKTHYDPHNMFRVNFNIPPLGAP